MIRRVGLASETSDSSRALQFEMYNFKSVCPRRLQHLPGASGGIVQDYGINEFDRVFTGQAHLTKTQGKILEGMAESSDYLWRFTDGERAWWVTIMTIDLVETFDNGKRIYELELKAKELIEGDFGTTVDYSGVTRT